METGLVYSEELTKACKETFGEGIVERVFKDPDAKPRCLRVQRGDICIDGAEIFIEFANGNVVVFSTSDWSNISKANFTENGEGQ